MSERGITQGTILYDSYVIQETLGEGGFGITYRATRKDSGENVAIKEYFPLQLAARQNDSDKVVVSKQEMQEYLHGKERFLKEASILKEFQYLQGIVKVWDCFETNNTAYIIMEYIDGITLKEYVSGHGTMEYMELMDMLSPVLKSLIALHKHGVIHRDISPDNLMIGLDNDLYLIDFGAAKEMEYGKTTTVLLKAGYAPPEQYLHDGDMGAWTDVYGICATIYTVLSGKIPTDAVARLQGQELVPLSEYGVKLQDWQQDAIINGMRMRAAERFRNVEQLYDALTIEPSYEEIKTIATLEIESEVKEKLYEMNLTKQGDKVSKDMRPLRFVVLTLLFLAVGSIALYGGNILAGRMNLKKLNEKLTSKDEVQKNMIQTSENMLSSQDRTAQENTGNFTEQNLEDITIKESQIKLCNMPNVVGKTEDEAIRMVTDADVLIEIRVTRVYSNDVAHGVVIEQSVKPDTQYNEGALKEIVLIVSDGPQQTTKHSSSNQRKKTTENDYFDIEVEDNKEVEFYLN